MFFTHCSAANEGCSWKVVQEISGGGTGTGRSCSSGIWLVRWCGRDSFCEETELHSNRAFPLYSMTACMIRAGSQRQERVNLAG